MVVRVSETLVWIVDAERFCGHPAHRDFLFAGAEQRHAIVGDAVRSFLTSSSEIGLNDLAASMHMSICGKNEHGIPAAKFFCDMVQR